MKNNFTIAAEGIKRNVPPSFGLFVNRGQAKTIIDALKGALDERDTNIGHFWVQIYLDGNPCLFNGDPIEWSDGKAR